MLPETIEDLLTFVGPAPGGDTCARLGSSLAAGATPCVIFISATDGEVAYCEDFGEKVSAETIASLQREVAAQLAEQLACRIKIDSPEGCRTALGVRLATNAPYPFVASLLDTGEEHAERIAPEAAVAVGLAGLVAKTLLHFQHFAQESQARTEQLLAASDSLRASHARQLAEAIEEHESRLREQEEADEELKRLHACNQLILDSVGEGIVGLDSQGRVTFVNPAAERLVGWHGDQLVGKPLQGFLQVHQEGREACAMQECPVYKTLHEGVPHHVQHDVFWCRDGSSISVEFVVTPMFEKEEIVGAVLTFRDITERRLLEGQLLQAQKLESIGQLAAGIAHEINTPTQFIGDNLRFLKDAFSDLQPVLLEYCRSGESADDTLGVDHLSDCDGPDARTEATTTDVDLAFLTHEIPLAIAQSLEGAERVANIVRAMKEFSHPGNDEMQLVDLNRALESTLTVCRNEWKYVAEVVTDFERALPPVYCLPGACNQVFLNLIINAAHAIADKPDASVDNTDKITVATRADGDWVEVRVSDTGTGIPDEIRTKVFDPFFTTKEVGRGTGQGLAIARSVLTDKHGGTLSFETKVGCGTTFIVRLPRAPSGAVGERSLG